MVVVEHTPEPACGGQLNVPGSKPALSPVEGFNVEEQSLFSADFRKTLNFEPGTLNRSSGISDAATLPGLFLPSSDLLRLRHDLV